MDAVIKLELESDSDGVPLPSISSEQEYKLEEHVASSFLPDADDVKCEYQSDPEYDEELRKINLKQQFPEKQNEEQSTTLGETQIDSGAVEEINPFECNICGHGFKEIFKLSRHLSAHKAKKTSEYGKRMNKDELPIDGHTKKVMTKPSHEKTMKIEKRLMDSHTKKVMTKPSHEKTIKIEKRLMDSHTKKVLAKVSHEKTMKIEKRLMDSHTKKVMTKPSHEKAMKIEKRLMDSHTKKVLAKTGYGKAMKIEPSDVRLPFRCIQCRIGFNDLLELSKHIRKAKGHSRTFEMFVCPVCNISFHSFSNVAAIRNHIGEHTGVIPVDVTINDMED